MAGGIFIPIFKEVIWISPIKALGYASYFYAGRLGVKQSGLTMNQRCDLVEKA